ncbi:MAG: hypothetical protein JKY09_06665 [Crocinitomicaceae bacterium]|nr:hypothetical protein [Crocinitomicaceae bacterium]
MKKLNKKTLVIFFVTSFVLALIFFIFPINIFDGEVVRSSGLQEVTIPMRLSLSYFIGLGYDQGDMDMIKDFYLTTKGWLTAVIFIFGFPALFAYRMHLRDTKKK